METSELYDLEEVEKHFDLALRPLARFGILAVLSLPTELEECIVLVVDAQEEYARSECPAPVVCQLFSNRANALELVGDQPFIRKFLEEEPSLTGRNIPVLHLIVVGGHGQHTQCVRLLGLRKSPYGQPKN